MKIEFLFNHLHLPPFGERAAFSLPAAKRPNSHCGEVRRFMQPKEVYLEGVLGEVEDLASRVAIWNSSICARALWSSRTASETSRRQKTHNFRRCGKASKSLGRI